MAGIFHDHHERLHKYCRRDMPVDMHAWRVTGTGLLPKPALVQKPAGSAAKTAAKGTREVLFEECGDYVETRIYDAEKLAPGAVVAGLAVAELPTSTLVVFPRHTLTANPYGDFHIEIPQDGG